MSMNWKAVSHESRRARMATGLALFCLVSTSGCATVFSEKRYPVTIENATAPTYFSVQNRKNEVIHQGVTPQQVTLDAKAFPFWPAKYSVVFAGQDSASQTHDLKAGVDPWIAGNLLLGGVPGTVIDGATGAMFRLPKSVQGSVPPQFAVTEPNMGAAIARAALSVPSEQPTSEPNSQVMMASSRQPTDGESKETPVRTASARENEMPIGEVVPGSLMR